jgi:hypothetical protein
VAALDPSDLFDVVGELRRDDRELVMIEALDGFVDAGSAKRGLREHLLGTLPSQPLVRFDVDVFHDYRARRPAMVFNADHWESYDAPTLEIRQVTDESGRPFLMLVGSEPDVLWERFVAGAAHCAHLFGVGLTLGLNAIPMGVPHTRPAGITAHGNRREVLALYPPWIQTVTVPASIGHLLEYRLSTGGAGVLGFAVHVPHYLAQAAYPAASLALLRATEGATGLRLAGDRLEAAAREATTAIDGLVTQSEELRELVAGLETQYDAVVTGRAGTVQVDDAALPTGDELGAELERFLAEQNKRSGDDPPR